jgi:flagellar motor switch protein FliN/FliY
MSQEINEKLVESWRNYLSLHVPLSVELGSTKLKVQEILEFDVETVIKLTRSTGEGVDVFADGHALLRGEIVAIEDRSAVRVSEIFIQEK